MTCLDTGVRVQHVHNVMRIGHQPKQRMLFLMAYITEAKYLNIEPPGQILVFL